MGLRRVQKYRLVLSDRAISDAAVWRIVAKRRDLAGLDAESIPHSFRGWFVTSLLENGEDLLTVARALGHWSPVTTQRCDGRGGAILREVVSGLDLPTIKDVDEEA
jgi:integrase/recombinase XerD